MFNYFLYRIGQFIALSLPLKLAYWVAVIIADVHYCLSRKDRQTITENLLVIFPDKPWDEIKKIRINVFRNFAKYLVDFFRFSLLDSEYIKKYIKVYNTHYIDEALAKGRGIVLLTAHLGNWELGGVIIALLGYPFWAVVLPHKHKYVDKFFNSQRENKGMKVIAWGRAARQSIWVLKNNQILALVADRNFSDKGIAADFFGRPALFPRGPAVLSLKTKAEVLTGCMVREKDDSFSLRFDRLPEFSPSGDEEQDMIDITVRYKTVIEEYILKNPDQWYMFRKFWST
ncbi:MAG: lysophospholipid acyltransferase family protein [Candidatus Omnitrophota bacterium]